MITYRPSYGNGTSLVGVDSLGKWYGKSLGSKIIKELLSTGEIPFKVDSKLISTVDLQPDQTAPTWFLKDVTDFDFIKGSSTYRCLYIGAEELAENLPSIELSVSNTNPSIYPNSFVNTISAGIYLNDSINLQGWVEGKYNILSSENSFKIDDENDGTELLEQAVSASSTTWSSSITGIGLVVPGEYFKIWLKITAKKDRNLINFKDYSYTFNIATLSIKNIEKVIGRLNMSRVYSADINNSLDENNIILTEEIPYDFDHSKIIKISEKGGYTHIFYTNLSNKLHDLIIQRKPEYFENKYIDYDISSVVGVISGSSQFSFNTVVDCLSGALYSDGTANTQLGNMVNKKSIIEVIPSNSPSHNIFYLFFNELKKVNDQVYFDTYQHDFYTWSYGVLAVSYSNNLEEEFLNVEAGISNKKNYIYSDTNTIYTIKDSHYTTSVFLQDDLFVQAGFDLEDCRIVDKKSYITTLWEKEIIKGNIMVTDYNVPKFNNNEVVTVENRVTNSNCILEMEKTLIDRDHTNDVRSVDSLYSGQRYVNMGSPHGYALNAGSSRITFDGTQNVDSFSATWAFKFDRSSIETPGTTGTSGTGTSGTSGTGTSGTSGTSGIHISPTHNVYDQFYEPHANLLLQSDYVKFNDYTPVYTDVTIPYQEIVKTRNDSLLSTDIANATVNIWSAPITATDEVLQNKILSPLFITNSSNSHFGRLVKLSGDGNTALIVPEDPSEVDASNELKYSGSLISRVLIYRRCQDRWVMTKEVTPYDSTFNRYLLIENENQLDISEDGNTIAISSPIKTSIPSSSGAINTNYNYEGYAVRVFTTKNNWQTYTQSSIPSNAVMPTAQKSYLTYIDGSGNVTYDWQFGKSICLSQDGKRIGIGSPSEYLFYQENDSQGFLKNQWYIENSGAFYVFTTEVSGYATSGAATSASDIRYGQYISSTATSGASMYYLGRYTAPDSSDISVGGKIPDCHTNQKFEGKHFAEKISCNSSGYQFGVSAKFDNSINYHNGAIYGFNVSSNNCANYLAPQIIKVIPSDSYSGLELSNTNVVMSKNGKTVVAGSPRDGEGSVRIFDLDWAGAFVNTYTQTNLVASDDTKPENLDRDFGQHVAISKDASIVLVKDNFKIRTYKSIDSFIGISRNWEYTKNVVEFNKEEKLEQVYTESGESFHMDDLGDSIIVGCFRTTPKEDERVFVYDYLPGLHTGSYPSTACANITGSDLYSTPIYENITTTIIEKTRTERVQVDVIPPEDNIGDYIIYNALTNKNLQIFDIHCNGNPADIVAKISYNFNNIWTITTFDVNGSQVTVTISGSSAVLYPYLYNIVTVNTLRTQVTSTTTCGKKYWNELVIYVNGVLLTKTVAYTFDTINNFVISYNPLESFKSFISYYEIRDWLLSPRVYNINMSRIYQNVAWAQFEAEVINDNDTGAELFAFKRNIVLQKIDWDVAESLLVPIVLQGNGYNIPNTYSQNIIRSIFNFDHIDSNSPSFRVTYEGLDSDLPAISTKYDYNKDTITIWVRLDDWHGQRLTIYYGNKQLVPIPSKSPFAGYLGWWNMERIVSQPRIRYENVKVYDGGEALVYSEVSGKPYLSQIDKYYMAGNVDIYKSNKYDIAYDDKNVRRQREDDVKEFIVETIKPFTTAFMNLRDIRSMQSLIIEANNKDS